MVTSPTYQEIARNLQATELLVGQSSVEVFEVRGGLLRREALPEMVKSAAR